MSKHLTGFRDHAALAMASIRGEGWKVRQIAADVWKVRDRRPYRWERQRRPRWPLILNRAGLLEFAGVSEDMPLSRIPYWRHRTKLLLACGPIQDADIPF